MTTVAFTPSSASAFQFQATLDGAAYQCSVPWNVAAQRYYLTITDNSGNQIVSRALVGSTTANPINLVWSYFTTSTLVYYSDTQIFVISP